MSHTVDQGQKFGRWDDRVSRWMYTNSARRMRDVGALDLAGHVGDYGGANGLLREALTAPGMKLPVGVTAWTTVDSDSSKAPDVVDNVVTHAGAYDVVVCRYLLHYLPDGDVIRLFDNMRSHKAYVIQFVNSGEDLRTKYRNSAGEGQKYFRTHHQLKALLPARTSLVWESDNYSVDREFYANRLGVVGAATHLERLVAYEVNL